MSAMDRTDLQFLCPPMLMNLSQFTFHRIQLKDNDMELKALYEMQFFTISYKSCQSEANQGIHLKMRLGINQKI